YGLMDAYVGQRRRTGARDYRPPPQRAYRLDDARDRLRGLLPTLGAWTALSGVAPAAAERGPTRASLVASTLSAGLELVREADLAFLMTVEREEPRRLSRAAHETLAIVAYHQPVTRPEIEVIRGVQVSRGTLDALLELRLVRIRGRRRSPGRPVTYGTTDHFL